MIKDKDIQTPIKEPKRTSDGDIDVKLMRDTKKPIAERREAFNRVRGKLMNPKTSAEFDPKTFDPMEDHPDTRLGKRARKEPLRRLPTMGMRPKEVLEGQMIGMYESKQDLYLMIAWLSERVSDLEDELKNIKNK